MSYKIDRLSPEDIDGFYGINRYISDFEDSINELDEYLHKIVENEEEGAKYTLSELELKIKKRYINWINDLAHKIEDCVEERNICCARTKIIVPVDEVRIDFADKWGLEICPEWYRNIVRTRKSCKRA